MGIYVPCTDNNVIYPVIYFITSITLIIVGSLYETDILQKNKEYTKNSVWWYGFIGIILTGLMVIFMNYVFKYIQPSEQTKTYFWYISHVLCYFAVTFVSPGQWPFWLAIGITWELFECYFSCKLIKKHWPIGCNGMYDIVANLAGISIAMWIRSEMPISGLS